MEGIDLSYHDLSECTLTPDERFQEKNRILTILQRSLEPYTFTDREFKFIKEMLSAQRVSTKQLFYLRDIKDKYL